MLSFKKIGSMIIIILSIIYIMCFDDTKVYFSLHTLIYWFTANLLIIALVKSGLSVKEKVVGTILQLLILCSHIYLVLICDWNFTNRLISVCLFIASFGLDYYILKREDVPFVFSELSEESLSFEDIKKVKELLLKKSETFEAVEKVITPKLMKELILDLNHARPIRYVNKNNLTKEYLEELECSMGDSSVYIVLSDTGSPASDVIGLFTQAPYNHASISFDRELHTLISYNCGLRVTPPGLNAEMLNHFFRKEDASIRIYRLPVTQEQKRGMIERVKEINEEGSAYNLIGLATKRSVRANSMFCSEFVYKLLCTVGAEYFTKRAGEIQPSDLIELDYDRKLEFIERIELALHSPQK